MLKRIFCPKRPNLAQNWHFWSIWARPCRLIQCPVGGSVGGCGARAVSRKTPIYFIFIIVVDAVVVVTSGVVIVRPVLRGTSHPPSAPAATERL